LFLINNKKSHNYEYKKINYKLEYNVIKLKIQNENKKNGNNDILHN